MIFKNISRKLTIFQNLKPSGGFTLVEMMVVISVIGILYLIVFGSVSDSKARGRDAKRIADIGVIQLALERYYDEFKKYPNDLDSDGGGFFDEDISVPTKDSQGNTYVYSCSAGCQTYNLSAQLDLYNNILSDDAEDTEDTNESTTDEREYNVVPKF